MATWIKSTERGISVWKTTIENSYSKVVYSIYKLGSTDYQLSIRWYNSNQLFIVGIHNTLVQAKRHATEQYGQSPR